MTSMMPKKPLPASTADLPRRTQTNRPGATATSATLTKAAPASSHRAMASLPVLGRAHQWATLSSEMATRVATNVLDAMATLPARLPSDTRLWDELMTLNQAALERLLALQADAHNGYTQWVSESVQLRQVKTLSNLVVQEGNLAAQLGTLMEAQLTNWVSLMENLQVDYGYWVAQQQPAPRLNPESP